MKELTTKQSELLEFIVNWQANKGHPPTQEEIREHFGFSSLNSVRNHLQLIEKKGHINLNSGKARGIQVVALPASVIQYQDNSIPLLGAIAAGLPIWAEQNLEGYLPVPPDLFGGGDIFALRVLGDSMIGAGINNGDLAIIKKAERVENGEIAAVLVEQEATLKRVFFSSSSLMLKSDNPAFVDLTYAMDCGESVRILGRFQGIIRTVDNRCCS